MDPYFAVIVRAFLGLDGLTVVTSFEIEASSALNVGGADWLSQEVVVNDLKVAILDAGLQVKFLTDRPLAVNHVSSVAFISFEDKKGQALSRLRKELNKGSW